MSRVASSITLRYSDCLKSPRRIYARYPRTTTALLPRATRELLIELRNEKNASLGAAKSELAKIGKMRERLINAIADGVPASEVKDELTRITARRRTGSTSRRQKGRNGVAASGHGRLITAIRWQALLRREIGAIRME
jgi:hypothetical protein